MIRVTTSEGRAVYLSPQSIAWIREAGASSQWHGIRSNVKCSDGQFFECQETAREIEEMIQGKEATNG